MSGRSSVRGTGSGRIRLAALAVCASLMASFLALDAAPADAAAPQHTLRNVKASPDFMDACVLDGARSQACISRTVAAINHARKREHLRRHRLVLPRNYASLSRAEQVFVVINLERVDRGIRPIAGITPTLNAGAKLAAVAGVDPTPLIWQLQRLGVHHYQTLWAQDYGVLASDYEWMYNDGWSGADTTNIVCPSARAAGCWAHRRGLLMRFDGLPLLLAGTGAAQGPGGSDSVTAILTGGYGRAPHFTYTWQEALAHGADRHRVHRHK